MIPRNVTFTSIIALLLVSAFAYAERRPVTEAQGATAASPQPPQAGAGTPAPTPPYLAGALAPANPATLSSTLSYSFLPAAAFTPAYGNLSYVRQGNGCVNQMPLGDAFAAPVYLPQASQVVSITLFTYDSAITTTISTAYLFVSDAKGFFGYSLSASSQPNTAGYQQNTSTKPNPTTVDYQDFNYSVSWVTKGSNPSPILSLCGVRLAYYAPLGATFLPSIMNQ